MHDYVGFELISRMMLSLLALSIQDLGIERPVSKCLLPLDVEKSITTLTISKSQPGEN